MYNTLSEAIADLQDKGYTQDFNLHADTLECKALDLTIGVDEFVVDSTYRFEGDSNPDDSSILFAVSVSDHGVKGLLVDAYGTYSDPLNYEMIQKLKYKP